MAPALRAAQALLGRGWGGALGCAHAHAAAGGAAGRRAAHSGGGSGSSSSKSGVGGGQPAAPQPEAFSFLEQHDEPEQVPERERQALLRSLLRQAHAAEAAMAQVLAGQQAVLRGRPDAALFADQEREALAEVQQLLPRHRARPSALLGLLRAAGLAAGAAAALAPPPARAAVMGALQESLTQLYNDQLRAMRAAGLGEAPDVRALVLRLRDLQRVGEGAPAPPDVVSLAAVDSLASVGAAGVLGAAVKAVADAAVAAAQRV
ncbi:coq7 [Scenedesmus sp. PABB004]|nr:coq7 [Scenedesmus sp. PABB004]